MRGVTVKSPSGAEYSVELPAPKNTLIRCQRVFRLVGGFESVGLGSLALTYFLL